MLDIDISEKTKMSIDPYHFSRSEYNYYQKRHIRQNNHANYYSMGKWNNKKKKENQEKT